MTRPPEHAHAVLHYNLNTTDLSAAESFYTGLLGLERRMQSSSTDSDGTPMGLPGPVTSEVSFLYDRRGPRAAPALELVRWTSPATRGEHAPEPNHIGLRTLGYRVATLTDAAGWLSTGGWPVEEAADGVAVRGGTYRCLRSRDPDGVPVELVEDPSLGNELGSSASHLRLVCSDLERSAAWYRTIGFDVTGMRRQVPSPGARFGLTGDVTLSVATLALPEDPSFSIELEQWDTPPGRGSAADSANHRGLYRMALAVDDVPHARDALGTRGPEFGTAVPEPSWIPLPGTPLEGLWILFLTDPDGVVVEFVERPRSELRRPNS